MAQTTVILADQINDNEIKAKFSDQAERDALNRVIHETYLSAVPSGTMNESLLEYNANDEISGYNGSAFAIPEVTELTAGTDLKIENGIISVNTDGTVANSADMSFVAGSGTYASGIGAAAFGVNTSALGDYSFADGYYSVAVNKASHAEGGYQDSEYICYTSAIGLASHAECAGSLASGIASHAEGWNASANGNYGSHAEGSRTIAQGEVSHAEGNRTNAIGDRSHAEGYQTSALGVQSHAEGMYTSALGNQSHAEGYYTSAVANNCHAEGNCTIAGSRIKDGNNSITIITIDAHAEGSRTSAIGSQSHAEGNCTSAYGWATHAEGYHTSAVGETSHTEGQYTIAGNDAMHVGGKYNKTSADALFVIGNGTSNSNRSDAFIITSAGLASATTLATSGIPDVEASVTNKLDTSTFTSYTATADAAAYTAGANIDITNHIVSGKDWTVEINEAVGRIGAFTTAALANNVPDVQDPSTKLIYLTKDSSLQVTDPYTEWIFLSADPSTTAWQVIGETTVDLSELYILTAASATWNTVTDKADATALNNYVLTSQYAVESATYLTKTSADTLYQVSGNYMTADGLAGISGKWEDTCDTVIASSAVWGTVSALTLADIFTSAGVTNVVYSANNGTVPDTTAMSNGVIYMFAET